MKTSWYESLIKGILIGAVVIVGIVVMLSLIGWIVSLLWNYVIVVIFGLPTINMYQGIALLILCNMLFGRSKK
jgi:hypothetical protein